MIVEGSVFFELDCGFVFVECVIGVEGVVFGLSIIDVVLESDFVVVFVIGFVIGIGIFEVVEIIVLLVVIFIIVVEDFF